MLLETELGLKISGVQSSTSLLVFQVFLRQIIVDREIKTLKQHRQRALQTLLAPRCAPFCHLPCCALPAFVHLATTQIASTARNMTWHRQR